MGHPLAQARQAHEGEALTDAGHASGAAAAEPEAHVLRHGEVGEQRPLLRDHRHLPAVRRHVHAGQGDDVAGQADAPGLDALEPGQAAQQRGLAAAGGAENGEQLAGGELEVDAGQHGRGAVGGTEVGDGHGGHGGGGHGPHARTPSAGTTPVRCTTTHAGIAASSTSVSA